MTLHALPSLIYDAALDAARWPAVLERLQGEFGGCGGVLIVTDPLRREMEMAVASGLMADPGLQAEYQRDWAGRDPAVAHFSRMEPGKVEITSRLWPTLEQRQETAFHREFYRPHGFSDTICVSLEHSAGRVALLALMRAIGRPDFGEADVQRLRALTPHLQRSLQLHEGLLGQLATGGSFSAAVDRMASGLVVLDGSGAVVAANAAARAIAARDDGLSLAGGRLGFPDDPAAAALFRRFFEGAAGRGPDAAGGGLLLRRRGHALPYGLTVAPAAPQTSNLASRLASASGPAVMVVVTEAAEPSAGAVAVIARHFALTPSEEALLAAMVEGRTLAEHAAARGISANAARFHAKAIFAKTRTRGQSDLVRLALTMTASLAGMRSPA